MKIGTIYVYPMPGGLVRMPRDHSAMPETGASVPDNAYWRRRLKQRDVMRGEPGQPPKELLAAREALGLAREQNMEAKPAAAKPAKPGQAVAGDPPTTDSKPKK